MPIFKDGTFRGEVTFNRLEFAKTLSAFILELETMSGVSLADSSFSFYAFEDLEEQSERAIVEPIANQYNLYDGIPGIEAHRFEPRRPVNRYEMAAIFDKLMRLVEKKRLITAPSARALNNPFNDVNPVDYAYRAVLNTVLRYQILSGFPDATFRGRLEISRYQFAATAAQAFALIREQVSGIVRQRLPKGSLEGTRFSKFHGDDPSLLSLGALWTFNMAGVTPLLQRGPGQYGGLGAATFSWKNVSYPAISEFKQYRDWTYPQSRYFEVEITAWPMLPVSGFTLPLVGGRDLGFLALGAVRMGINDRNAEPFHIQPYWGGVVMPDLAVGIGNGAGDFQAGLGVGPLAGILLYHRLIDPLSYSLGLELGPIGYVGFRRSSGNFASQAFNATQTTLTSTPTALEAKGPGSQDVFPLLGRPYLRLSIGLQQFSRPDSALHLEISAMALPGGLHDDPPSLTKNLATLAAGISIGSSWK
ncbi:MAG: S-layer homology domain-containing protein [Cyanobacteria bacterium NC_groundwater_1444_Ag_S-0.65um_54_12]|nr:S-layer homology domain-containing protein [Cyanobacteria bacterium NC_groundwater_1444_Ag_S-0.65um_54_12]